ncbi:hypothetical protein QWJ34_17090 [Saccharibacillus sp. CPCC 101409]|uniref:hypothetical protein n=1 Tax=Saccharibacillus sp. CPCC 101409 TaxID=3058041 RepID=UPI0026740666|nr:hypothetical protein [Saccharibacillus sp. CPCC 101409]MDO3411484.1 hypothetical protein [Saccharibacillus sp. CPCC 101409]
METTAFALKAIGAIIQVSSIIYIIVAIVKRKAKHIFIGIILLIIAIVLLNMATKMEDRIRRGDYYGIHSEVTVNELQG